MDRPSGPKTEMKYWRGGLIEFCRDEGCGFNGTAPSDPPWYVVRYRGRYWGRDEWHYIWIDYAGPPQVFLTRAAAEQYAKNFRRQYGGGEQSGGGPLKVEVVKLIPDVPRED